MEPPAQIARGREMAMKSSLLLLLVTALASWACLVQGELNACLGVETSALQTIPECTVLYQACQVGVGKLNDQLHVPINDRFSAVSVISASESVSNVTNDTLVAMLLQLAPVAGCVTDVKRSTKSCTFDMTKVEIYSILLTFEGRERWNLDGFKHHVVPEEERQRIAEEYKSGHFYGTNLAIGIFDTDTHLPVEAEGSAENKAFTRSPLGIVVVLVSASVSVGLLFHQRRRLQNGYAPILIEKRKAAGGHVQSKGKGRSGKSAQHAPLQPKLAPIAEKAPAKEPSERFAV